MLPAGGGSRDWMYTCFVCVRGCVVHASRCDEVIRQWLGGGAVNYHNQVRLLATWWVSSPITAQEYHGDGTHLVLAESALTFQWNVNIKSPQISWIYLKAALIAIQHHQACILYMENSPIELRKLNRKWKFGNTNSNQVKTYLSFNIWHKTIESQKTSFPTQRKPQILI